MRAPREHYGMSARNIAPDVILPPFRSSRHFLGLRRQGAGFAANVPATPVCEREESHALLPDAYLLAGVSILLQDRRRHSIRAPVSRCPTLASARRLRWPRAHVLTLLLLRTSRCLGGDDGSGCGDASRAVAAEPLRQPAVGADGVATAAVSGWVAGVSGGRAEAAGAVRVWCSRRHSRRKCAGARRDPQRYVACAVCVACVACVACMACVACVTCATVGAAALSPTFPVPASLGVATY